MTKVKICGLRRREDVEAALQLGADALGFVLEPTSPRFSREDDLLFLHGVAPFTPKIAVFGPAPELLTGVFSHIQAVEWADWKGVRPQIQSVRLRSDDTLDSVLERANPGKTLLLDAFSSNGYGGMGEQVDWNLAAQIVRVWRYPVILAGGLTPENVREAIEQVRPYAVDVSSGIELEPGVKSHEKMTAFIRAAKSL